MEFINELTVWNALIVVIAGILLDAVLGILKTLKPDNENFDLRKLPQFVQTQILPYVGGLGVLAIVAEFIGQPYDAMFYPVAVAVLVKYAAEIKDKLANLFGLE